MKNLAKFTVSRVLYYDSRVILKISFGVQSKIKHNVSMVFTVMLLFFRNASRVPVEKSYLLMSWYCVIPFLFIVSHSGL